MPGQRRTFTGLRCNADPEPRRAAPPSKKTPPEIWPRIHRARKVDPMMLAIVLGLVALLVATDLKELPRLRERSRRLGL
jgi:hypothetical protein